MCSHARSLTVQKRCSLKPVRRLLQLILYFIEGGQLSQLSALFHEGGQIFELINSATLPPAGLLPASVASCSPACAVVRPRLAGFGPVWLFSSCQRPRNQEGALGAPCSCDVLLLAIAPSGRENAAGSAFKSFRCYFVVRGQRFIMLPAMMVPRWWRQMHAQSGLVQSQAEPSWQEGSDI